MYGLIQRDSDAFSVYSFEFTDNMVVVPSPHFRETIQEEDEIDGDIQSNPNIFTITPATPIHESNKSSPEKVAPIRPKYGEKAKSKSSANQKEKQTSPDKRSGTPRSGRSTPNEDSSTPSSEDKSPLHRSKTPSEINDSPKVRWKNRRACTSANSMPI